MACKIKSPAPSLPSIEESASPPSHLSHVYNDKVLRSASHPLDVKHNSRLLIPRSTSPATTKPILISVHVTVGDNDYTAACAIAAPANHHYRSCPLS
ncbi:hypothetical protein L2E82_08334 [Cichorium intybus]|uniref:Uncharacterized protein n=1 Tax=Cichorium intybus TaxID=13427 RepID=A0ACB9G5N1_CICIN|nr:hypothetical protein L2E82_08334 [Cichorium intybus]